LSLAISGFTPVVTLFVTAGVRVFETASGAAVGMVLPVANVPEHPSETQTLLASYPQFRPKRQATLPEGCSMITPADVSAGQCFVSGPDEVHSTTEETATEVPACPEGEDLVPSSVPVSRSTEDCCPIIGSAVKPVITATSRALFRLSISFPPQKERATH
jgi:hypothetical protein